MESNEKPYAVITGVSVTILCSEATSTGFFGAEAKNGLHKIAEKNNPVKVAQDGLKAMFTRRDLIVSGFAHALQTSATKLMPRSWIVSIIASMLKNK